MSAVTPALAETPAALPRPRQGPLSLFTRTSLALAVSASLIAMTAIVAMYLFVIAPIAERSADHEAALMVLSAQTWVELPPPARPYFELELAENHDLIVGPAGRDLPLLEDPGPYQRRLQTALSKRLQRDVALHEADDLVWADIPMGGYLLQIGVESSRTDTAPFYVGFVIAALGAIIVLVTSLLIVQRLTQPLVAAARAAECFRGGAPPVPLPERGPRELVTLARSFNTMAREVADLMNNRTTLLAGISHDLRTPIARMRLAVELLPDAVDPALVDRLRSNLGQMDELIGDTLRFARGLGGQPEIFELKAWLEEWLARRGGPRATLRAVDAWVNCAPQPLERVLDNLVSNAAQHAGEPVEIETVVDAARGAVRIHVLDRGCGIPDDARARIFQPFFRLEASRSRDTGGSGLGLAIVDQLCRAQGWDVRVEPRCGGGSDFSIQLALAR